MKETTGKGIIISLIVIVIIGGIIWGTFLLGWKSEKNSNVYIQNYERELKIWGRVTPEKLISKYGEPEEVNIEDGGMLGKKMDIKIQSDIFTFTFNPEDDINEAYRKALLSYYVLENDRIKLGKKEISVGSSRKEVIAAYGSDGFAKDPGTEYEYIVSPGLKPAVSFYYDENDLVKRIEVHPNGY